METKQVIIIRRDLKMRRGKECAQVAHASMAVFTRAMRCTGFNDVTGHRFEFDGPEPMLRWFENSFKKVVVYVISEEELLKVYDEASKARIPCSLIQDSGKTEFGGVPTYTTVAVGPDEEEKVDKITGNLPLY